MAGYIGNIPVPQGTQTRQNFTATASQTSFPTIGYTAGFIDVYLNGVKLISGTDFTATNGSDVVLAVGASASDVLDVVIFDTFTSSNGTFNDATLKNNATLKNDTHEDSDGGRASKIIYQGEQSGGEISTLAEIQASHDGTADDQKGDLIFKTNDGSDNNAPTEAARIDSSRNVLVGKTAVGSTAGIEFRGSIGYSSFTRDGNFPVTARRLTDDGDIIQFEKDTTVVGKIASLSGTTSSIVLDPRTSGVNGAGLSGGSLSSTAGIILPTDGSGALEDSTIDLGHTNYRFKDLKIGGGIYLGGTTSSNYLTDYEEGTWTPNINAGYTSATFNIQVGTYTKIGNIVRAYFRVDLSGGTAVGTAVKIGGLPFTVKADGNEYPAGFGYINDSASLSDNFFGIALQATTNVGIYTRSSTTVTGVHGTTLGNSLGILYTVIYRV